MMKRQNHVFETLFTIFIVYFDGNTVLLRPPDSPSAMPGGVIQPD